MLNMDMSAVLTAILMIFYLYLGVRWQYVKRPWCYMFGATGIAFVLFGQFFGVGGGRGGLGVTMNIFNVVGILVAFKGAVGAVYGGKIPIWDVLVPPKGAKADKQAGTPPAD